MTEDFCARPDFSLDSTADVIPADPQRTVDVTTGEIAYTENTPADSSDIEALYLNHFRELGRLAYLLTSDLQEAEDVVAEVFLKVSEHYDVRTLENPLAFLRAAVVNRSRSVLRHRTVQTKALPKLLPGSAGDSTYESAASAADTSLVMRALRQLPIRQRQAVVLRYYVGLSEREAAETMGIRLGSVKSHTARGVESLRKTLGPRLQQFM